jgi:uncharacterized protein
MRLSEVGYGSLLPVEGYGPGFFRIGGALHEGAALLVSDRVAGWGGLDDRAPLFALAGHVDVLIVGMGDAIAPLPADLRTGLEEAGIGVEMMATPTACRSYNVLLSEGRRVAAALLPVTDL